MDAIKKKMVALREETDRAVAKANTSEAASNEANERADEWEEKQRKWQKKLNEKQDQLDVMLEQQIMAEIKAEEKEKMFNLAEQQRTQAERTIILKEEEVLLLPDFSVAGVRAVLSLLHGIQPQQVSQGWHSWRNTAFGAG